MNLKSETSLPEFFKNWRKNSLVNKLNKAEKELVKQRARLEHWSGFKSHGKDAGTPWAIVEKCGDAKEQIAVLTLEVEQLKEQLSALI